MLNTISRQFPVVLLIIALLIFALIKSVSAQASIEATDVLFIPQVVSTTEVKADKADVVQVRFGHGRMRQMPVGGPSACLTGTTTDLVATGEAVVLYGYHFETEGIAVLPTIEKINGKDEAYLVSFGALNDFLLFEVVDGVVTATHMVDFQPIGSYDLSQPSVFLGWDVSLSGNRVTIADADSIIWLTASGKYFCNEVQTSVTEDHSGIYRDFITEMTDPSYEKNYFHGWKIAN